MKIAFLLSRFPHPLDKGDKLRAFHQIKHLSKSHNISIICISDAPVTADALAQLQPYCDTIKVYSITRLGAYLYMMLALFSSLPFQCAYFFRNSIKKCIWQDLDSIMPDAIFCQLVRMSEYVKDYQHPNKVLDYMDTLSHDMKRRQHVATGIFKLIYTAEEQRVVAYEKAMFTCFQKHSIISQQDKDRLPIEGKHTIEVIPNGTDTDITFTTPVAKQYDILFFGNLSYAPNIESALFLAQSIVPLLLKKHPHLKVLIAGATPHKKVLELANNTIEVKGWIEDKWTCFASAKVFAAPMLINVGMQNKILETMAVKTPCVVTTLANNAIGAKPGVEVIEANTPEEFSAAISQLLENPALANEIAQNAYTLVANNYSWQATTNQLEQYLLK